MSIAVGRMRNEIRAMGREGEFPYCHLRMVNDDCLHWKGIIVGPADSPYEGGLFSLAISLPSDYPIKPPRVKFTTKVYHPNIDKHGRISLDILYFEWSPVLDLVKVLLSISALLCDPILDDSLEPKIAHLYQSDRRKFNQMAREWTRDYAMPQSSIAPQ